MPPLTQALIIVNVLASVLGRMLGNAFTGWFALWPPGTGLFMPWQLVTYAFLHGGLTHLAFNMFGLWMFGSELERIWGSRRFGIFYAVSVLTAAGVARSLRSLAATGTRPQRGDFRVLDYTRPLPHGATP